MQVTPKPTQEVTPAPASPAPEFRPEVVRLPVHRFRVAGFTREFSLTKRAAGRFEPWYLVSIINGRRFHHSLKTADVKLAEDKARVQYILPALGGDWKKVEAAQRKKPFATIGEVLAHWVSCKLECGEAHKRAAANQLRNVLRQAGVANPDAASTAILTEDTAARYFDAVQSDAEGMDQQDAARRRRTAVSTWNQARCVLRPAALLAYKRQGLNLPDVSGFEAGVLDRLDSLRRLGKHELKVPDLDLMAQLLASWPALGWNEFAGVGLALAFGLRAGEWAEARWEWFRVRNGRWVIEATAEVKNQSGRIEVRAINPYWATFIERARREGRWQAEGYVLTGSENERQNEVEERISAWMRSTGWTAQKTNHAFRAFAGALVVLRWGSDQARIWLRHSSVTTTERHYTKDWLRANAGRPVVVEWAGDAKVEG